MSLLAAPLWLQVLIVAEAAVIAWLVWRFGWRGLLWGLAVGLAFWFLLGLVGSFLISRLEGTGTIPPGEWFTGAVHGAGAAAQAALGPTVLGALLGALLRRLRKPKPARL